LRSLLSKWLQYSGQHRQMRILMCSLNRTCEQLLQSKIRDKQRSIINELRQFVRKSRLRRACCVRVELIVQVICSLNSGLLKSNTRTKPASRCFAFFSLLGRCFVQVLFLRFTLALFQFTSH
jgi:hypothetical protein